jgi:hypothetical protein
MGDRVMKTKINLGKPVNVKLWVSFCVPIIMESSVRGSVWTPINNLMIRL